MCGVPGVSSPLLSPVLSVSFKFPMAKVVLGKGLGALISANKPAAHAVEPWERVERVALTEIVPSPLQPRKIFSIGPASGTRRIHPRTRNNPTADRSQDRGQM